MLTSRKKFITVNINVSSEICDYYRNIWSNIIDKCNFYMVDTDEIFVDEKEIEKVCKVLNDNNIKFTSETSPSDYMFLNFRSFIKFKNGNIEKLRGIKLNDTNYCRKIN